MRFLESMAPIAAAAGPSPPWPKTDPAASDGYKAKLTDALVRLACRSKWSSGAVATGVVKRAVGAGFRGDVVAMHDRLSADTCPASKTVSRRALRELSAAADTAKGQ